MTHICVNTSLPNHTLHPISAPSSSGSAPSTTSFLYLQHLPPHGPFPSCFSTEPGPTMLTKQTIKIKPLLNPIPSLPSSVPLLREPIFFSGGLHSWPPHAQSHLLNAHCNLAFLLPLHWDCSCQVHQQFPRSTGYLSGFSLFDYCSI